MGRPKYSYSLIDEGKRQKLDSWLVSYS